MSVYSGENHSKITQIYTIGGKTEGNLIITVTSESNLYYVTL